MCPDPVPANPSLATSDLLGVFLMYIYVVGIAISFHIFMTHGLHFYNRYIAPPPPKPMVVIEREIDLEMRDFSRPPMNEPSSPPSPVEDSKQPPGMSKNTGSNSSDNVASMESDATNQDEEGDEVSVNEDAINVSPPKLPLKGGQSKPDVKEDSWVTLDPMASLAPLSYLNPFGSRTLVPSPPNK